MSGSLPSGATITVNAWDSYGNALTQSASAAPIPLNNYGTTSIVGTDLIARFPGVTPMLYSFVINSPMTVMTNVKKSEDGLLNFPITFMNGLSNFAVNTVGPLSTVNITDMSGALSSSGAAITVTAYDSNGNALTQSASASSPILYNNRTTTILGTDLANWFQGTPMTYQFAVPSSKYIFTNVKKSTDGTISVPISFTSGTTNYSTNSVGSLSTLKITDMSGSLPSGATITVNAWDSYGNALTQSASAPSLTLSNHGTTTIKGTELAAWFTTSTTPTTYQIAVASSQYIITNVTSSTDGSINIPTVFTSGTNNFTTNSVDSGDTIKISDLNGSLGSSGAAITVSAWDVYGNALAQSGSLSALVLPSYGTISIKGSALAVGFLGTPAAYAFSVASPNYLITTVKSTAGGTLNIPNVVYTVPQSSPAGQLFASTGGTGTVSVTTSYNGNWTATSNAGWITITSGSSGSGNGNVNYTVLANSSSSSRTGTMTVAGQAFTVTQSPPPSCTSYSISATSQLFVSTGGPGSVSVIASSGCPWVATSNVSWINITSGSSGTGNGTVAFTVAANTGTSQRTGTMAIAGQTFTVTQSPPSSCTYSISPASQSFVSTGGPGSVSVTASSGCPWVATSNVSWINITSGSSGTGSGTVAFTVAANTGTSQRTGTMTIAGQTFTVTQSPPSSCTYSISPTSAQFDYTGGTRTVSVTTSCNGNWTATSNVSWITITSGSSGTGNGTVAYTVAGNSDTNQRTGTMTIAEQTFTVTESGYFIIGP
jgi:hypothetical protein